MFKSGVIERTESAFGSMNFVIDHYSDLRKKGELHRYKLQQFSCSFFSKLYRLRFVGWIGRQDMLLEQADIGAKIRKEMDPTNVGKDDCSNSESSSDRVFYAMGTLDGINIRFLREWLANGRRDVRDALRRSAGDAHVKRGVNEYIEKLGISDEHMVDSSSTVDLPPRRTEWDPARHKHRRPTLILKGEADPVTVGGQAEYFHFQALLGPRMLIKFPGVGHEFDLPDTAFKKGLDGIIKLEAKRFSPGQVAEVKGAINGLKLNPHLKLRLLPPHDLEPGLRLVGVGRVAGKAPNGSEDDIVALIQNTSGKEVPASKRVWKIENEFFTGKVEISPGRLAAGQTKPAYGKIIDPRQNEAYQVRVKASNNWDVNLKPLCTRDKQGVTEVMILNQKNISTEGKIGRLTIYNDYSSTDSVYIPFSQSSDSDIITFGPNQDIYKKLELPHEAKWQTDHEDLAACLPNAHDLSKVLAQEAHCDLPLVVQHSPKSGSRKEQQWTIDSPTFTATISSRLESCMPDGNPYIVKGSAKLILKDWIEIREPSLSPSQGDFELLGYNILDGDQISLILKNPPDSFNVKSVGEKGRDWFYELSNRNKKFLQPCHPFFDDPFPARNCLIFSYLVMDPLQFINVDRNEILQDIMQRFDAEHGVVHFCPLFGGIRIPGLRDPNQIFTCE
jgi:hypothetical protein